MCLLEANGEEVNTIIASPFIYSTVMKIINKNIYDDINESYFRADNSSE